MTMTEPFKSGQFVAANSDGTIDAVGSKDEINWKIWQCSQCGMLSVNGVPINRYDERGHGIICCDCAAG